MGDDVIKFITYNSNKNSYGVVEKTEVLSDDIFCKVEAVGGKEFFRAGQNKINPEYKITTFHGNYSGENLLEYNGKRYTIYRHYRAPNSDYVELYTEEKIGTK